MALMWNDFESYDLHVLRNGQPSTELQLFVTVEVEEYVMVNGQPKKKGTIFSASKLKSNPALLGNFKAIAYLPSWVAGNELPTNGFHTQNGIQVETFTGKITANAPPAGSRHVITSFVVRVVLYLNVQGNPNPQPHPDILQVMVHVHNAVTSVWLTPAQLNAKPDIIKGYQGVIMSILTAKTIKKITVFKDPNFTEKADDLFLDDDPFDVSASAPGDPIRILASLFQSNRSLFPNNDVFYNPIHLEVEYDSGDPPSRLTLPLHMWYQIKSGDILKDQSGNDLFEIFAVTEKLQYHFSVYASFDDGTIGDITTWHGIDWVVGDGVSESDINFDVVGAFRVTASAVSKTLEVKAKLPGRLASATVTAATGQVKVDPSWLSRNLVATAVPKNPLHPQADNPVNILFISEGYTSNTEFSNTARDICTKLREDVKTTPWNLLFKNAINTWMLFEKSEETGASILYESVAVKEVTLLNNEVVDLALPLIDLCADDLAPKLSNHVTFFQFISRVGLPIPDDLPKSKSNKIEAWKELFNPGIDTGDWAISDAVFNHWKKLAKKRTLVEERNTAFGLRGGSKPSLEPPVPSRSVNLNENSRLGYQHITQMLSRIRVNDPTGAQVGEGEKFWGRDKDGRLGKDYGLIVFLVNGLKESGAREAVRYYPEGMVNQAIAAGMGNDNFVSLKFFNEKTDYPYPFFKWKDSAHAPAVELVPFTNIQLSIISASATIAHELGHFFHLRDEYASPDYGDAPEDPTLKKIYNLQGEKDLLDTTNKISGELIKWRWPRIRKAGIMATDPAIDQPAAGSITLTLKRGHASIFKEREEVYLRKKNVLEVPHDKLLSPKLSIFKIDHDTVEVRPVIPGAFQWADFKAGSLLALLTKPSNLPEDNPPPDDNSLPDEYAEVMSSMVRKQINSSHKSMTKEPCKEDLGNTQEPGNLPSLLSDPDERTKIIGLYSGGDEYSCKIFHPSGQCIMRTLRSVIRDRKYNMYKSKYEPIYHTEIYPFCHVCRYSLVDQISPTHHGVIDRLYDSDYPRSSWYTRNKFWFWFTVIGVLVVGGIVVAYLLTKDDNKDNNQ